MLVLTRKVGEAIRIGADVTVQVLEVRGGQVRLGFIAPAGVRILRDEVFRAMESANGTANRDQSETVFEPQEVVAVAGRSKRLVSAKSAD